MKQSVCFQRSELLDNFNNSKQKHREQNSKSVFGALILFVCFALPSAVLAYFRNFFGNNNFIVCKFFQVIPAYFSAKIKSVSGKAVFINGVYFCVIFALAVYVVRAVGAYNITAVCKNKYGIFSVKNINNTAHTADKIFTVSFTHEKLYAQAVMRTEIKV